MTDRIRRERIVSIRAGGDGEYLNVLVDEISPERHLTAHQELARLAQAFDCLSLKCRDVVWMRRVTQLSQKEVAQRLGLSEKSVEKHLRNGMRKLAHYMYTREQLVTVDAPPDVVDPAICYEAQRELGHDKQN
jgi:RNA polymerase sigma-70 factor (ECF subfamily)